MISSKPYQYTKGWVEFYKLRFKVTPDVLIPRPETELLVDEVLKFVSQLQTTNYQLQPLAILDLGTGSGNIAISIAKNLSVHPKGINTRSYSVDIIATDISASALKIAKQNAQFHRVEKQITFIHSNLLDYYDRLVYHNKINPEIIVVNLPYIPSARIPHLDSSVRDFEPLVALDGGEDGFELYRKLFQQIRDKSWKPKLILGEIDYTHGELAINEAQKYFPQAKIEVKTDLAHKQRILLVRQFL